MTLSLVVSKQTLAQAFSAVFDFVLNLKPGADERTAPIFTYLLTQKQKDDVDRICTAMQWPTINCLGVLIDCQAVRHVIHSHRNKDATSDAEIQTVMTKAYSPRSIVLANRAHGQQTIMLNTHQKVKIGSTAFHGLAVLQIEIDGARSYLAPVTSYHATEAKARAIR